jgi:hypothetical protein
VSEKQIGKYLCMEISPASKGDNAGSLWEMFIQQNVWINFL